MTFSSPMRYEVHICSMQHIKVSLTFIHIYNHLHTHYQIAYPFNCNTLIELRAQFCVI